MASWMDVDFLMTQWYQEASVDAHYEIIALDSEVDDLLSIRAKSAAERSIRIWAIHDLSQQKADLMEDHRPQVRLATADRQTNKSLRW